MGYSYDRRKAASLSLTVSAPALQDLAKSLNMLAKANGGRFKSEKQAEFLFTTLKGYQDPTMTAWAAPFLGGPGFGFYTLTKDERYGKVDTSKIRYYGFAYAVDGAGVAAIARIDVQHPKGDLALEFKGIGATSFQRTGDAPVLFDPNRKEAPPAVADPSAATPDMVMWRGLMEEAFHLFEHKVMHAFYEAKSDSASVYKHTWEAFKRNPTRYNPMDDLAAFDMPLAMEGAGWKMPYGAKGPYNFFIRMNELATGAITPKQLKKNQIDNILGLVAFLRHTSEAAIRENVA